MTYGTSETVNSNEEQDKNKSLLWTHKCPLCKKKVIISVDFIDLERQFGKFEGIIPHIILHGNPLHAMLCYIDKHMDVRGTAYVVSIGISRDSNTYQQITKAWSRSGIECIE